MENTTYEDVFSAARGHFRDYDFLLYDDELLYDVMLGHMKSAIADFEDVCQYDLSDRDDVAKTFNFHMGNNEIQILALGIAYYWIFGQVMDSEAHKNIPSTKDFTYKSSATLLASMQSLAESIGKKFTQRIINYSYVKGDISSLKA